MDTLVIENYRKSKVKRTFEIIVGLYLIAYCGYFMMSAAKATENGTTMFIFSAIGVLIGLILFVNNTLWVSEKVLISISETEVESNIRGYKFNIDWVNVSKVSSSDSSIFFYVDGGKKEKELNLSDILFKDASPVKERIIELCNQKNIVYTHD